MSINLQILIEQRGTELLAVQQVSELTVGNLILIDTIDVMTILIDGSTLQRVAVGDGSSIVACEVLVGILAFGTGDSTDSIAVLDFAIATQPSRE